METNIELDIDDEIPQTAPMYFFTFSYSSNQVICDNYVPLWWVEFGNNLSWLFTEDAEIFSSYLQKKPNLSQTFCYFHSHNFHVSGSPDSVSRQPTQLIVELNSSLRHTIVAIERHSSQCENIVLFLLLKVLHFWRWS